MGLATLMAGWFAILAPAAELMPPAQQNGLVKKYCAVCHTDAARNGGLSLEHYDAAQADSALAAILLTKLRNGAMGAAGAGVPDPAAQNAWIAATSSQAEGAKAWNVIRAEAPGSKSSVLSVSIVRDVAPRQPNSDAPVYRLTMACDSETQRGEMLLTWSPQPQTDRTFFVSADGNAGIPHMLNGREEKMGNGAALSAGLAFARLNSPLPERTLAIADLFPGERVVFPLSELDQVARRELAACFPSGVRE